MKKLAIVLAFSAAALLGNYGANAVERTEKVKATEGVSQVTDFSSRRRHRVNRYYRHHSYRPYRSYGYAPQPYYGGYGYGPGYYSAGPVLSFSFGGGHRRGWGHGW